MYSKDYNGSSRYLGTASRYFEQNYGSDNSHVNIDEKRAKNIEKIQSIIDEKVNVDFDYDREIRNIIVKVNQENKDKTNEEKDKIINTEIAKLDIKKGKYDKKYADLKKNKMLRLREEILRQAKRLLVFKNEKDIYDYYMAVVNNPLPGEYKELEIRIYREFFMTHPGIENIIIAYEELANKDDIIAHSNCYDDNKKKAEDNSKKKTEDDNGAAKTALELVEKAEKTLSDEDVKKASKAVGDLKDSDDKTKLYERLKKLVKKIEELKEKARKAVDKAYKTKTKEDIKLAKEAIDELGDSVFKEGLLAELKKLIDSLKVDDKSFVAILNKIMSDLKNNGEFSKEDLLKLVDEYQKLDEENAKKYADTVKNLISTYNCFVQKDKKDNYDPAVGENDKYTKGSILLELVSAPYRKLINSNFVKRMKAKKLERLGDKIDSAEGSRRERLQGAFHRKLDEIRDYDIPSGVKLFTSKNRLIDMKPTLYKEDYDQISSDIKARFEVDQETYTEEMSEQLKENSRSLGLDSVRVTNVLDQYIELLSYSDQPLISYNDAMRVLEKYADVLSKAKYLAYKDMFNNILTFRTADDSIDKQYSNYLYEYDSQELCDTIKYYDSDEYKNQKYKVGYIR